MDPYLIAAIGGLTAAVVHLYLRQEKQARQCEQERRELTKALIAAQQKSCGAKNCEERDPVQLEVFTSKKPKLAHG